MTTNQARRQLESMPDGSRYASVMFDVNPFLRNPGGALRGYDNVCRHRAFRCAAALAFS